MLSFIGIGEAKPESLEEVKDAILRYMPSIRDEEGTTSTSQVWQRRVEKTQVVR